MNKTQRPATKNSFADRHRLAFFVLSFCLGLVVCLMIAKVENGNAHGNIIAPVKSTLTAPATIDESDSTDQQPTLNDSNIIGQAHSLRIPKHVWATAATANFANGRPFQTLTSLGIRLQI